MSSFELELNLRSIGLLDFSGHTHFDTKKKFVQFLSCCFHKRFLFHIADEDKPWE